MTIDELKEFASSEDGKTVMSSFLEESGYRSSDDIKGLENKKNELLGKLKEAKDANNATLELFKKYDIIDADDLSGKLATLANAKSAETDLEKMARRLEIIEKTAAEDKARAEKERSLRVSSEKKSGIVSALKNAHVDDGSFDFLIPYFDKLVKAEEEDGKVNLIVESDDGSSPFSSFVDEWSKTDKAKQFIKAPSNRGGGAGGPGDGKSGGVLTLEQIGKLPTRAARLEAMAALQASQDK